MSEFSDFYTWSHALYHLTPEDELRMSRYLSDTACDAAGEIVNPECEAMNDKTWLGTKLPERMLVDDLGTINDGVVDGDPDDMVVIKPSDGTQGDGVVLAHASNIPELLNDGYFNQGKHVITRWHEAHPTISRIWPQSSNSMRIMTYVHEGEPVLLAAVHKWGSPRSGFTDNWTKGGYTTLIMNGMLGMTHEDFSTLEQRAGRGSRHAPINNHMVHYTRHPDSGRQIYGEMLPFWDETVQMVLHAADIVNPEITYVGWDVIITKEGPRIIEGNPQPGVQLIQNHIPLLGDQDFRDFLYCNDVPGL